MNGSAGFLTGIIGSCLSASIAMLMPVVIKSDEGGMLFLVLIVVAFVFLNVAVVGVYRMLAHLHETVLYPDDPCEHSQPGRVLFLGGHVGLLATLVFVVVIVTIPGFMGIRIHHTTVEVLLILAWMAGWICVGLFLGGIRRMLTDAYEKAFFRGVTQAPAPDDQLSRRVAARDPRPGEPTRRRPWDED